VKGQQCCSTRSRACRRARAVRRAPLFGEEAFSSALEAQAAKTNVADRAHFLGFRSDVPELMRASDAIVHASCIRSRSRVIVEECSRSGP